MIALTTRLNSSAVANRYASCVAPSGTPIYISALKTSPENHRPHDNDLTVTSTADVSKNDRQLSGDVLPSMSTTPQLIPAFDKEALSTSSDIRGRFREAIHAWLQRSPSVNTRDDYARDVRQFLSFTGLPAEHCELLATIRPRHVSQWRDHLRDRGLTNSSIRRKLTTLRSLFSYLQTYGYTGANPAHSDFVEAPVEPRDGKTVGLSPEDCRRLLDAPDPATPVVIRDRAILATLADSAY